MDNTSTASRRYPVATRDALEDTVQGSRELDQIISS